MDRRHFVRLAVAGSAMGIIAPQLVLAGSSSMAGGIYYTKDAPGRWSKKVLGHLPNIEVSKTEGGASLQIITPHEMKGYEHYIIKHVLLDQNFDFISEKSFDPMKDKAAVSNFELVEYQGPIHVLSMCNQHDTWLNIAEI